MSRGTFTIDKPEDLEATLTFTMRVSAWAKLREQLNEGGSKWPSCDLSIAITEMVHALAKREIWSSPE